MPKSIVVNWRVCKNDIRRPPFPRNGLTKGHKMRHRKSLFIVSLVIIFSSPAFADRVVKSSKDLATTLNVTDGRTAPKTSLYSVCVSVKTTEYVDIRYQAELTNDLPGNVGLGHEVDRIQGEGVKRIGRPGMENITPDMHHKALNGTTIDSEIPADGNYCYHLRAWAVSNWTGVYGNSIKVENGYGQIIAIVKAK